ncbi:MAG: hypothetical protein AAF211_13805 [Myxococcota bacterium]
MAETVYLLPSTMIAVPLVVAAVCLPSTFFLLYVREWWRAAATAVVGTVAAGLFAPPMLTDRIVVGPDEIVHVNGTEPRRINALRFDEVVSVEIVEKIYGRDREVQEIWELTHPDGSLRDLDPGDNWVLHRDAIIGHLTERGIEVRDAR